MTYSIRDLGKAAVRCARDEWERVVRDPEDAERIKHYHRATGADWALDDGEYEEYEDFWCGVFAAYCFRQVGDYLHDDRCVDATLREDIAGYLFASTTRLAGHWRSWKRFADVAAPLVVDPAAVQPGDIVVVRTGRTDRTWGDHVTLARGEMERDEIPTFEGNAFGVLGNGSTGEGVIRDQVLVSNIAVIYRLRLEYFVGSFLSEIEKVEL